MSEPQIAVEAVNSVPHWLQTVGTAAGAALVAGYAVWRRLRTDVSSDKVDAKTGTLIETLERQLQREIEKNEQLGTVIDRLSGERNNAVQQVGRLEGTVHALESEVRRMTDEIRSLEQKNIDLSGLVDQMTKALNEMGQKVVELTQTNETILTEIRASKEVAA